MSADYTDVFARFTDPLAADTLASYIASAGIPCDVVEVSDLRPGVQPGYGIRVARKLIDELKATLRLTPVAHCKDPVSPHVIAGRLAREGIPCYVGDIPVLHVGMWGPGGYSGVPIDDKGDLGFGTVAVPAALLEAAQRILGGEAISDAELAELALHTAPDPDDPP